MNSYLSNQTLSVSILLVLMLILSMALMSNALASGYHGGGKCDKHVSNSAQLHYAIGNPNNAGKVICLAKGVYKPTNGTDRDATFITVSDITLRGKSGKKTILSGNIGNPHDKTDNSLHVVTVSQQTGVVFKNLTVAHGYHDIDLDFGGNVDGKGADILNILSEITLDRVIVRDNEAVGFANFGAGVAAQNSADERPSYKITVRNSLFVRNVSELGGALGTFHETDVDDEGVIVDIKNTVFNDNATPAGNFSLLVRLFLVKMKVVNC